MKEHLYKIKVEWTGNLGSGTMDYRSYNRSHLISGSDKYKEIQGSSDPSFLGDSTKYNPEEAFLSSISACHMLWYLHLCAVNKVTVMSYVDEAKGVMEESKNGAGKFKLVTLKPRITIIKEANIEKAKSLHQLANEKCFIANSCNFKIQHEPIIIVE